MGTLTAKNSPKIHGRQDATAAPCALFAVSQLVALCSPSVRLQIRLRRSGSTDAVNRQGVSQLRSCYQEEHVGILCKVE